MLIAKMLNSIFVAIFKNRYPCISKENLFIRTFSLDAVLLDAGARYAKYSPKNVQSGSSADIGKFPFNFVLRRFCWYCAVL